jgi:cobyrinic acid a,c-diamide synthase
MTVHSGRLPADGFVHGSVHASYLHLHWAVQPSIASRLGAAAL